MGYTLSSLITQFRVSFWNDLLENYKPKVQDLKDFAKISKDFIREESKKSKILKNKKVFLFTTLKNFFLSCKKKSKNSYFMTDKLNFLINKLYLILFL